MYALAVGLLGFGDWFLGTLCAGNSEESGTSDIVPRLGR